MIVIGEAPAAKDRGTISDPAALQGDELYEFPTPHGIYSPAENHLR